MEIDPITELKRIREQKIQEVKDLDIVIKELEKQRDNNQSNVENPIFISKPVKTYYLYSNPVVFKGEKPIAVIISNRKYFVATWKGVVEIILNDCLNNPQTKGALYSLSNCVLGRNRTILSNSKAGMKSPVQIQSDLFFEAHYDTQTLITILVKRILDNINYDYSNITIELRN